MIVFSCAKTGGHIYPAISLAQELDEDCVFMTTPDDFAHAIIRRYGYQTYAIPHLGFNVFKSFCAQVFY